MSKKHFIALADMIRDHNRVAANTGGVEFQPQHLAALADFCRGQNGRFNRSRWLGYIAGECGPCGGTVKKPKE